MSIETITTNESLKGYRNTLQSNAYRFFLDEEIKEPSYYRDLISTLYDASEYDSVELHINTPGGRQDAAIALCDALMSTKASTTALVTEACSAGSSIMLACENCIIFPNTTVMIHQSSWGDINTAHNLKTRTDFAYKQLQRFLNDTYSGFLTTKEIKELLESQKEFWMGYEEIGERLNARAKYRLSKLKKTKTSTAE